MSNVLTFAFITVPNVHVPKFVLASCLATSAKTSERWGDSFYLLEPCVAWRCVDIEAICTPRFKIIVRRTKTHSEDGEISVIVAIM